MEESCFHSLYFLSSLVTINDSFMEKQNKTKKQRIAASSELKSSVQSRNKLRKFFFSGINIKQQSVLFFSRHFRRQGISDSLT